MYKKIIRKVRVQTIHLKTSSLHDLTPANLSVIVAPHPDDEVFGCCGLMQRLIAQGKRVELIVMTGGGKSHAGCCDIDESELIRQRRQLTIRAAKEYGLSQEYIHFLDYPDGGVLESASLIAFFILVLMNIILCLSPLPDLIINSILSKL